MSEKLEPLRKEVENMLSKMKSASISAEEYRENLSSLGKLNELISKLIVDVNSIIDKSDKLVSEISDTFSNDMIDELKETKKSLDGIKTTFKDDLKTQNEEDKAFLKGLAGAIIKKSNEGSSGYKNMLYILIGIGVLNILLSIIALFVMK